MLALELLRVLEDDQGTIGELTHDGRRVCWVLELPDRGNAAGLSRIPAGEYIVDYLQRSASGKYQDVYHVRDVPGRSGILGHPGNWAGDRLRGWLTNSYGCLLPATRLGYMQGQRAGLLSRKALNTLHALTGRQSFRLRINDHA